MNGLQNLVLSAYQGPMGPVDAGDIMKSLILMGKGMLGIFVVMMLIWLVIVCLNKFTVQKEDDMQDSGR